MQQSDSKLGYWESVTQKAAFNLRQGMVPICTGRLNGHQSATQIEESSDLSLRAPNTLIYTGTSFNPKPDASTAIALVRLSKQEVTGGTGFEQLAVGDRIGLRGPYGRDWSMVEAEGRVVDDYEQHFAEEHRAQPTALFSLLDGEPYLVGPLARLNLNLDRLPDTSRTLLKGSEIRFPSNNMLHSLLAFGLEQSDDALRLRAETVIRNCDPCISCATHFLKLDVRRQRSACSDFARRSVTTVPAGGSSSGCVAEFPVKSTWSSSTGPARH